MPLILNLRTGHLSPQFHVVFDDDFSTVPSLSSDSEPSPFWDTIDLEENTLRILLDDNTSSFLDKDWLTPAELEERSRLTIRQAQIRRAFQLESSTHINSSEDTNLERLSSSEPKSISFSKDQTLVPSVSTPTPFVVPEDSCLSTPSLCHRERSNKGSHKSVRYINEVFLASVTG